MQSPRTADGTAIMPSANPIPPASSRKLRFTKAQDPPPSPSLDIPSAAEVERAKEQSRRRAKRAEGAFKKMGNKFYIDPDLANGSSSRTRCACSIQLRGAVKQSNVDRRLAKEKEEKTSISDLRSPPLRVR